MENQHIIKKLFKRTGLFFALFVFILGGYIIFSNYHLAGAQAQEVLANKTSTVTLIVRNDEGDYIPNINYEIYTQISDVDGRPKPGKKIAGGIINATTGKGEASFSDNNMVYALKVWQKNASDGAFYFYDDINVYDSTIELTETLSAIKVVFRDTEDNLLKNINFSIYTQREDVDGKPIKEANDLVGEFNTSAEGEAISYLASGMRSLDGEKNDYYVMEVNKSGSGKFYLYDIGVNDGNSTLVNYVFSDMKLVVKDSNGVPFPAKTKVAIYKQVEDADGERVLGDKVKDVVTNDDGVAIFEYPAGTYVARILGADKQYQNFWDLEVIDQTRREYTLTTESDWNPGSGECEAASTFSLVVRNIAGEYVPGIKYELYEQTTDVNGVKGIGTKKMSGVVDKYGKGINVIHPDPRKNYALKIYDKNPNVGEFWFYNELQFECGKDIDMEKTLPGFKVVLRDGAGELLTNHKFSLYTQKHDVDGRPIKEKQDLVATGITTSQKGEVVVYIAPDDLYDRDKRGTYVFTTKGKNNKVYNEYNIDIVDNLDYDFEYILSDVVVRLKNSLGQNLENRTVSFYEQKRNISGEYILGKQLKSAKTDSSGNVSFEFPYGYYAVVVKDSVGKNNIFWNTFIKNRKRSYKNINTNTVRIKVQDATGGYINSANISVYSMTEDEDGLFMKDKNILTKKLSITGKLDLMLSPAPYIISIKKGGQEFGQAIYTENEKLQEVFLKMQSEAKISVGQKFKLEKPTGYSSLAEKLRGRILLQVEERGEAWYVDMKSNQRHYMKDGNTAYNMMRKFGVGITNTDLKKIPIGLDDRFTEFDYDGDRVSDKMEEAIGTDMHLADSDNDGYMDGDEIDAGYNPLGSGMLPVDKSFGDKQKGKILLQVESRGEAWYVNPADGKRYYMKDGDSAYEIMRFLSLGITNVDLEKIEVDEAEIELD